MAKDLLQQQNDLIAELMEQVQNLKADNYALVEELKNQVSSTEKQMSAVVENERNFHREMANDVSHVASSTACQIRETAKTAIDEAVAQGKWKVKQLCEDSEKKIRSLMQQFDWLREKTQIRSGFQKLFFWLAPVLLLAQTIALTVLLLR